MRNEGAHCNSSSGKNGGLSHVVISASALRRAFRNAGVTVRAGLRCQSVNCVRRTHKSRIKEGFEENGIGGNLIVATTALATLTLINCLGVKTGGRTQSALMVMKILAIAALVIAGAAFAGRHVTITTAAERHSSLDFLRRSQVPVLFSRRMADRKLSGRRSKRAEKESAPRILLGVLGVVVLYISVNWVCLRALGHQTLAVTGTPATAVMRLAQQ